MGPPDPYGPPIPSSPEAPTQVYGPEPVSLRPVVLVLGPGLARGYAYVGAIRALNENKIPIGAVLGTEMGALVGALYAMDGKINRFEWALLKFREDSFSSSKGVLGTLFQKSVKTRKFESELEKIFENKDLNQSALPLRLAVQLKDAGSVTVLERGQAAAAVRAAMADQAIFDPATWNGIPAQSAAKTRPFLISEARAMGLGPVIVVSALDEREERQHASAGELKDADLVIRPDLKGIGAMDFDKRTDAAFRGKKAINAQIKEIRHLVGLPTDGDLQKGTP